MSSRKRNRYFYDTEFLEDGSTIELISIGIIDDAGRELYLVNADAPRDRIVTDQWLLSNVWAQLPVIDCGHGCGCVAAGLPRVGHLDTADARVMPKEKIRVEVEAFLTGRVELWADTCAYDHVVLAQLWGKMIDLPGKVPWHTNDIQTLALLSGVDRRSLPSIETGEHHALADAREVKARFEYISRMEME